MSLFQQLFSDQLAYAISNALLHSLWQGGLLALILIAALHLLRNGAAQYRYRTIVAFVFLFFAGNMATGVYSYEMWEAPVKQQSNEGMAAADLSPLIVAGNQAAHSSVNDTNLLIDGFNTALAFYHESSALVTTIWLIGMLVFSMKLSTGLAFTYRLRTSGKRDRVPVQWQHKAIQMAARLGIRTRFDLAESRLADTPMVIGIFRPMVLLPLGTFTGTDPAQIEAILAHELAHIQRRDYLVNLFMQVMESIYFYHPAVWFMLEIARTEREHCCDDVAVSLTGKPDNLIRALGEIGLRQASSSMSLAVGFGKKRTGIPERMRRLLGQKTNGDYIGEKLMATIAVIVTIGMLHVSAISGGPAAPAPPIPATPEAPGTIENSESLPTPGQPAEISDEMAHPEPTLPAPPALQDTTREAIEREELRRHRDALRKESDELRRKAEEMRREVDNPETRAKWDAYSKIIDRMEEEGLLDREEDYTMSFSNEELTINGEKQSDKVFKRYMAYYKELTGVSKKEELTFRFSATHDPDMPTPDSFGKTRDTHLQRELEMRERTMEEARRHVEHSQKLTEAQRKEMELIMQNAEKRRALMEKEMERVMADSAVWQEALVHSEKALEELRLSLEDSGRFKEMIRKTEMEALRHAMQEMEHLKENFPLDKAQLQEMMKSMEHMDLKLDSTYLQSIRESQEALRKALSELEKEDQ